jgi:hypothetical protein
MNQKNVFRIRGKGQKIYEYSRKCSPMAYYIDSIKFLSQLMKSEKITLAGKSKTFKRTLIPSSWTGPTALPGYIAGRRGRGLKTGKN